MIKKQVHAKLSGSYVNSGKQCIPVAFNGYVILEGTLLFIGVL